MNDGDELARKLRQSAVSGFNPMLHAPFQNLSNEQLMLLNNCRRNSSSGADASSSAIRTGPITVEELMGKKSDSEIFNNMPIMERLKINGPITRKGVIEAAAEHVPLVPGFPIPIRTTSYGDGSHTSTIFRPELFKTTMEAFASASAQHNQHGQDVTSMLHLFKGFTTAIHQGNSERKNYALDDASDGSYCPKPDLIPWYSSDVSENRQIRNPKSPGTQGHRVSQMRPNGGMRHNQGYQNSNRNSANHSYSSPSSTNHHGQQNNTQKIRKPYFMPYMFPEAVERGLKDPRAKLFQGTLRVNQRNYEESYIDNPDGDDQLDLLILGVHDRNRALHGDVVVVKIKERENWVVQESLYQTWRESLKQTSKTKENPETSTCSRFTVVAGMSLSMSELEESIPVDKSAYSRKELILIAAQLEAAAQKLSTDGNGKIILEPELQAIVEKLGVSKTLDVDSDATSTKKFFLPQFIKKSAVGGTSGQNRRLTLRVLSDLPEDMKIVPDSCLQKTAEVVFIMQQKNCRTAMGQLKIMADGNHNWALFSPTDSRMPRMMIPSDQLPPDFFERPQDYQKFLFVARMVEWQATAQFARGKLERHLGLAGDIEAETEGLLFANNIDTKEFSPSALSSLPISEAKEWKIEEKEFKYRRDLREELIFTIDPLTARDLDDALHIKSCHDIDGKGTGGWELGVHIADVTHFLLENTELDQWARDRATSTYLVHKVIPMLPRLLCEELCSLNPGVDRLCFSIIWKMTNDGEIREEKFCRTVIRSRCKLAYEHAQDMLEHPEKDFSADELPALSDNCSPKEISAKVHQLWDLASKLRAKRQENGSLRLDQPKLKFALDATTHMPTGVGVYMQKEANRLVEEYMLLANSRVAQKIENSFPRIAVLRRHPSPKLKVLREVLDLCNHIGFPIDASDSKKLSSGLRRFEGRNEVQNAIHQVLSMQMMKPMQLAQYFCTGMVKNQADYYHYALAMPFYTHFTSPIRRYPDVLVHRLLSAACGYSPPPSLSEPKEIAAVCGHCNDKKLSAKTVSEASADTFFGLFVKHGGPLEEKGVVVAVLDASFDVLVFKYGVVKRVYINRLDMAKDPNFVDGPCPQLTLYWKDKAGGNQIIEQTLTICSVVDVILSALPEPTKYQAIIKMQTTTETPRLIELFKAEVEKLGTSTEASLSNDDIADMRAETIYADID